MGDRVIQRWLFFLFGLNVVRGAQQVMPATPFFTSLFFPFSLPCEGQFSAPACQPSASEIHLFVRYNVSQG